MSDACGDLAKNTRSNKSIVSGTVISKVSPF